MDRNIEAIREVARRFGLKLSEREMTTFAHSVCEALGLKRPGKIKSVIKEKRRVTRKHRTQEKK